MKKIIKEVSLCRGTHVFAARHISRGKNKAKTGSRGKDYDSRAEMSVKIKRGARQGNVINLKH